MKTPRFKRDLQNSPAWNQPTSFYAMQGWFRVLRTCGTRMKYEAWKRGWMDGFWKRRRSPKDTSPCRSGAAWEWYRMGWSEGRDWKRRMNEKPKNPPPRGGGRRLKLTA
jgi:hypothetical protein